MAREEDLSVVMNIRISPEDHARLNSYGITASHVARVCMRLGLDLVDKDKALLLSQPAPKPTGRPKKKRAD